jgi:hypothetical protein
MSARKLEQEQDGVVTVLAVQRPGEGRVKSAPEPAGPAPEPSGRARAPVDSGAKFRKAAQRQALRALKVLAWLMDHASSEAVRASAANSVIDRAHGRAAQAVRVGGSGGEDAEGVEVSFTWQNPEKS